MGPEGDGKSHGFQWSHRLQEQVADTRSFLEDHPELLPKLDAEREAVLRQAYSEKIDYEATWAAGRMIWDDVELTGSGRKWQFFI